MPEARNPDRFAHLVAQSRGPTEPRPKAAPGRTEPPRQDVAAALFAEHLDLAAIRLALGRKEPVEDETTEFAPPRLRAAGAQTTVTPPVAAVPVPAPPLKRRSNRRLMLAGAAILGVAGGVTVGVATAPRLLAPQETAAVAPTADSAPTSAFEPDAGVPEPGGADRQAETPPLINLSAPAVATAPPPAAAVRIAAAPARGTPALQPQVPPLAAKTLPEQGVVLVAPASPSRPAYAEPAGATRQAEAPLLPDLPLPVVTADAPPPATSRIAVAPPATSRPLGPQTAPRTAPALPRQTVALAAPDRVFRQPAGAARQDETPLLPNLQPPVLAAISPAPIAGIGIGAAPPDQALRIPRQVLARVAPDLPVQPAPFAAPAAPDRVFAETAGAARQAETPLLPDLPTPALATAPPAAPTSLRIAAAPAIEGMPPSPAPAASLAAPDLPAPGAFAAAPEAPTLPEPPAASRMALGPPPSGPEGIVAPRPRPALLAPLPATTVLATRTSPAALAVSPRIVVHYGAAQAAPDRAAVLADLQAAGFYRVEWRAVPFEVTQFNVRFFFAADRSTTTDVASALGRTGYAADARDFTHYAPPPSPGTIEVWLAP